MIFQRCTRKCEHNFRIGNEVIDVVQNYTYLGTRITSSGNFTLSLEHLRQKALHALFSLRRHTDLNGLNIACRAELGKFPMIIDINKKILSYIDYLIGKDEDSIQHVVKQALEISIDLHHDGKLAFTLIS